MKEYETGGGKKASTWMEERRATHKETDGRGESMNEMRVGVRTNGERASVGKQRRKKNKSKSQFN